LTVYIFSHFFRKNVIFVPTLQQKYKIMNINKITIKILLEGVGECWSLLECWSVGTVFCFCEMQKNTY